MRLKDTETFIKSILPRQYSSYILYCRVHGIKREVMSTYKHPYNIIAEIWKDYYPLSKDYNSPTTWLYYSIMDNPDYGLCRYYLEKSIINDSKPSKHNLNDLSFLYLINEASLVSDVSFFYVEMPDSHKMISFLANSHVANPSETYEKIVTYTNAYNVFRIKPGMKLKR